MDGWGSLTLLVEISVQVVRVKVLELLQLPMVEITLIILCEFVVMG